MHALAAPKFSNIQGWNIRSSVSKITFLLTMVFSLLCAALEVLVRLLLANFCELVITSSLRLEGDSLIFLFLILYLISHL